MTARLRDWGASLRDQGASRLGRAAVLVTKAAGPLASGAGLLGKGARLLGRGGGLVLDRVAATAEQRLTLRRAVGVLAATTLVTGAAVTIVALSPVPGRGSPQWTVPTDLDVVTPRSPPARAVPRPAAVGPGVSPPAPPAHPTGELTGWAVLDRTTGAITGSSVAEVSTTASMIKAWLVADYLRRTTGADQRPSSGRLDQLTLIIRDSNNELSEVLFRELGRHQSIERLIGICQLTDSRPYPNFWSNTQLSPRDTARMGACLADGRAAGPEWTDWLLAEMRAVRGVGDFGIRHAFPPGQRSAIAIKNGWIDRDDAMMHVNCLGIGDTWTMGVMLRYPVRLGYQHGFDLCQSVAEEHLLPLLS